MPCSRGVQESQAIADQAWEKMCDADVYKTGLLTMPCSHGVQKSQAMVNQAWEKMCDADVYKMGLLTMPCSRGVQKSQAMADQAWEKMRATGSVQQGLESECATLRQQMTEAQHRANTLLTACALLCGAVYPMYARSNALSTQRHILEEQMMVWDNCRERAHYLVNVLNSELTQVRKIVVSLKTNKNSRGD